MDDGTRTHTIYLPVGGAVRQTAFVSLLAMNLPNWGPRAMGQRIRGRRSRGVAASGQGRAETRLQRGV
jgi:hypothetical protein